MKKFLFKISIIIIIPYILGCLLCEHGIRNLPNEYKFKNSWLNRNAQSLEIFINGSSPLFFNINPIYFDKKTFNGGHIEQSYKYDNFIFNKYIGQMDSLSYYICSISYNSLFTELEDGPDDWRVKNYPIYYNCPYHKYEPKYNLEIYDFSIKEGKNVFKSILNKGGYRLSNDLGYGTVFNLANRATNWKETGQSAVDYYQVLPIDSALLHENLNYLNDIFKTCEKKNITVLLLITPVYSTFYENGDPSVWKLMYHYCHEFEQKYPHVRLYDYLRDNRFTEEDFYDTEHLNEIGAKKFSLLLNNEIEKLDKDTTVQKN